VAVCFGAGPDSADDRKHSGILSGLRGDSFVWAAGVSAVNLSARSDDLCSLTSGLRLAVRVALEATSERWRSRETEKRTLIYGAGSAGTMLLSEVRNNPRLAYRVVGFVDDLAQRKGMRIAGVTVLGAGCDKGSCGQTPH